MPNNADTTIFDNYQLSDLFKEIKQRSDDKKTQLDMLFGDIKGHIKDKNDAIMFLPRIKEFMDVGVKNDEQLIKLAAVAQKLISLKNIENGDELLSEAEKQQLLSSISNDMSNIKIEVSKPVK